MYYRLITILTIILLSFSIVALSENEDLEKENIIAKVGSIEITEDQINEQILELVSQAGYKMEDIPEEVIDSNKKELLQRMVYDIAFDLYIEEKGHDISDSKLQEAIDEVASNFRSMDELETMLQRQGYTFESFKAELKKELLMEKIIKGRGYKEPGDEELKEFYNEHSERFSHQESVKASHILLSFDNYSEEDALARINEIKESIEDPRKDFQQLAEEFSDCPSGSRGGDLGFFEKGRMVPQFEETAFGLETGEVSDPVKTQFGYHLIFLTEKKPQGTYSFEEKRDEIFNIVQRNRVSQYVNLLFEEISAKYEIQIFLE